MESSFYPYIGGFCWVGLLLMVGTIIRAKVKIFQTMLFPASLIGGILGFVLINLGLIGMPSSFGWKALTPSVFSMLTFHLFAFGFVGIGLLESSSDNKEGTGKVIARGAFWMALIFGFLFSIQALIGKGTFDLWKMFFGGDFFTGNGYLLGAGFTQGPGQTQAYATIWEHTYQVANALNVGLAFAAVGFLVAGVVGVPLAYYGIRRGWISLNEEGGTPGSLPQTFLKGLMDKDDHPCCAQATTHPANIDSVGFHFGLMFALYGGAYAWGLAWFLYLPKGINGLGFGLVFCWGMFLAMITRKIMKKIKISHLIDPETTRRLTGTTVDFMICAVFMGIKPTALTSVVIPFSVSIVIASFLTLWACLWFGRRAPSLGFARAVTMFGYCTGTGASGLMLLRLVDPEYATPVALEVGLMGLVTFVVFKPISLCMPFAAAPDFPMIWIFVGTAILTPLVMYVMRLVGRRQF